VFRIFHFGCDDMQVKEVPFALVGLTEGFEDLVKEYSEETANPSIGEPRALLERYQFLNELGRLKVIGVFEEDRIVGIAGVMIAKSQHYPFPVASIESLYLMKKARKGTNGVRLLRGVKQVVKESGAPGIAFMAPPGSRYDKFCEVTGMTHTHNVWWYKL
jgi:hypothetical protein